MVVGLLGAACCLGNAACTSTKGQADDAGQAGQPLISDFQLRNDAEIRLLGVRAVGFNIDLVSPGDLADAGCAVVQQHKVAYIADGVLAATAPLLIPTLQPGKTRVTCTRID